MDRAARVITSSGFIAGLILLLANDLVLKRAFPGVLTGKLSDFAGLFIFPMFWAAFFPGRAREIFFAIVLGFIWWKSPLSQGAIDAWNAWGPYEILRVLDYTDLLALAVLPLSWLYVTVVTSNSSQPEPVQVRVMPAIVLVSAFAFGATSNVSYSDYELTPSDPANAFRIALPLPEFPERLGATGLGHSGPDSEESDYSVAFDECNSAGFRVKGDGSQTVVALTLLSSDCDGEVREGDLRVAFEGAVVTRLRGEREPETLELPKGKRLDYADDSPLRTGVAVPSDQIGAALDRFTEGHHREDGVYIQSLGFGYDARFAVAPAEGGTQFTVFGYINNYAPLLPGQPKESESTPEEMEPRFQYFLDYIEGMAAENPASTPYSPPPTP